MHHAKTQHKITESTGGHYIYALMETYLFYMPKVGVDLQSDKRFLLVYANFLKG